MARPSKLTPDTQDKIVQAITLGATYELACNYANIAYNTFNEWRKRGLAEIERVEGNSRASIRKDEAPYVEFYEAVKKAEGNAVVGWLAKIEKAANDGSWQAAAWKLERRYPDTYNKSRTDIGNAGGKPFEVEHIVPELPDDILDKLPDDSD